MKQQFFVGDVVKVVDVHEPAEGAIWTSTMDDCHGRTGTVVDIVTYTNGYIGYVVNIGFEHYNFAPEWLTIVERQWQKNTGEQPVDDDVEVEIKLRWPGGKDKCLAGEFRWDFEDCSGDIVEWRIADNVPAVVGDTFGFGKAADEIVKLKGEGMNIQGEKIKCISNFQAPELIVGKIYTAGVTRKNVHGVWQVEVEGKWYIHDRFELVGKEQTEVIPPSHIALGGEIVSTKQDKKHSHYFKKCGYDYVDVYRTIKIFNVTDPCLQHAVKKLLVTGGRGFKDIETDVQDVIDTLERWKEMFNEDRERGD